MTSVDERADGSASRSAAPAHTAPTLTAPGPAAPFPAAPRLRDRLVLLVAAVAVPFLVLTGVVIWSSYRDERTRAEQQLLEQTRSLAQVVDRVFEQSQAVLSTLAASPLLRGGDLNGLADNARMASQVLRGSPVALLDHDCRPLFDTSWQQGEHHPEQPWPPALARVLITGRPVISGLYRGGSGRPQVGVGLPAGPPLAASDGQPPLAARYVVAASLSPTLFVDALAEQKLPADWVGGVIDRSDHVVSRTTRTNEFIGSEVIPALRALLATADEGVIEATRLDGVASTIAFARAPVSGFAVSLAVPNSVLTAPLVQGLWRTLTVGVLAGGCGLGLALLMGRNIAAAIQGLASGAVPAGRAGPHTLREVQEVAERLSRTSAERDQAEAALRQLAGRLEEEVAARTAALARNEARLRAIFDAQFQFITLLSPDGERLEMNAAALAFGGRPAGEVIGHKLWKVDWWADEPARESRMQQAVQRAASGEFVRFEGEATRADGTRVVIDVSVKPIIDPATGAVSMLIAEGRDITELRRLEARLAQASRLEALGQLAGGIAHDFNNVLQAVSGGIALIARRADDPAAVARLSRMVAEAAERGTAITRRLLGFARRDELRAAPVAVPELLANLQEILRYTLGAGIEVTVDAPERLPPVLADRAQLEAVLVNLATNARDAMPNGGRLRLTADETVVVEDAALGSMGSTLRPGAFVRLSASDTGSGMDEATLARAMEPFFTTKPVGKGTGLGLAMARGFAEQSGGGLEISSTPGHGTTVTLWLPQAVAAERGAAQTAPPSPDPDASDGSCHLLLVDDDPLVRQALATDLGGHGYRVSLADSGAAALAVLDSPATVHLLVTDLAMPGMNGLELIRAAQDRRPGLPAILLTGYAGEAASLAVAGALSGSLTLLRKPVSGAHLADRVAALLERRGRAAPSRPPALPAGFQDENARTPAAPSPWKSRA